MALTSAERNCILRRLEQEGPKRWYHSIEVVKGSGIWTPGDLPATDFNSRLNSCGVTPSSLVGKRVLDIGTYTGALSFYLEDLGCEVVALDVQSPKGTGFSLIHELRHSSVEFRLGSVYDLCEEDFGVFDLIAFYGVFYHLKHPLLALDRINSVLKSGGTLIGGGTGADAWFHDNDRSCTVGVAFDKVTAKAIQNPAVLSAKNLNYLPLCGFASTHFFLDTSNWFIPNTECVKGWLKRTGFETDRIWCTQNKLPRDWNTSGLQRASIFFSAHKTGNPESEYGDITYLKRYNPDQKEESVYQFRIPVQSEVLKLQQRVCALEQEIEKLKGNPV